MTDEELQEVARLSEEAAQIEAEMERAVVQIAAARQVIGGARTRLSELGLRANEIRDRVFDLTHMPTNRDHVF